MHVTGQRTTEDAALRDRISQDGDSSSSTYAEYMTPDPSTGEIAATGRRIVFMPVQNPFDEDRCINFATFFLPPADEVCCPQGAGSCGNGNGQGGGSPQPCCAEYIGAGILYGIRKAASGDVAVYVPKLIEIK